ncbi:MAG: hypothetical protein HZA67_07535 [Rhodospirillales bacterium]|nr:hypothetical protein [Rhodospirillales bacterium]
MKREGTDIGTHPEGGAALLIIVAILAIIAALSVGTRYFGGSTRKVAQTLDTKLNDANVENAMAAFFESQTESDTVGSRLPCPADITEADASKIGTEERDASGTCTAAFAAQVLPWKTIGIPESQARDAWGNYYSYHVLDALTKDKPVNETNFDSGGDLLITGLTIKATAASATNLTDKAFFVVISHGPNGDSGNVSRTQQKPASTDADEAENTNGDTTYVKSGTPGGKFDDLLTYWIR